MDKRGRLANMTKMNANILHDQYQNDFNRTVNIDLTALKKIEEKPEVNQALGEPPSQEEIKTATAQMKNNKAHSISGFMTDVTKGYPKKVSNFSQAWSNHTGITQPLISQCGTKQC